MPAPKVKSRLGFYSRQSAIRNADLRTPEAKMIRRFQAELVEHCGPSIAPTKMAIIEAASILRFRMHAAATKFLRGEASPELDMHFLSVVAGVARCCTLLGLEAPRPEPLSLEQYVNANYDRVA